MLAPRCFRLSVVTRSVADVTSGSWRTYTTRPITFTATDVTPSNGFKVSWIKPLSNKQQMFWTRSFVVRCCGISFFSLLPLSFGSSGDEGVVQSVSTAEKRLTASPGLLDFARVSPWDLFGLRELWQGLLDLEHVESFELGRPAMLSSTDLSVGWQELQQSGCSGCDSCCWEVFSLNKTGLILSFSFVEQHSLLQTDCRAFSSSNVSLVLEEQQGEAFSSLHKSFSPPQLGFEVHASGERLFSDEHDFDGNLPVWRSLSPSSLSWSPWKHSRHLQESAGNSS